MQIDKNKIVDLLLDMSVSKDKVLYNLLKDYEPKKDYIQKGSFVVAQKEEPKVSSQFKVLEHDCSTCRFGYDLQGCHSNAVKNTGRGAKEACINKYYKYWEPCDVN